jgi:hypothetical protein
MWAADFANTHSGSLTHALTRSALAGSGPRPAIKQEQEWRGRAKEQVAMRVDRETGLVILVERTQPHPPFADEPPVCGPSGALGGRA